MLLSSLLPSVRGVSLIWPSLCPCLTVVGAGKKLMVTSCHIKVQGVSRVGVASPLLCLAAVLGARRVVPSHCTISVPHLATMSGARKESAASLRSVGRLRSVSGKP